MSIRSLFPDIRPSLNLDFANTRALDPRVTFARASTATYYDGKTVSKAEENLNLYSQQFNAWSNLDITLTADADIAPDGTQTADKSVPNGTNTRHISYLATNATINNLPYTYSAYFKAAGYNFAQLGLFLNSSGVDAYIIIDLTNGTVTQSFGNTGVRGTFTYSVQSVGNGWYRGVITCGNVTGMSWAQGMILAASNSGTPSLAGAGSPTFSGDGTSGILIWGAQMEQRSSVTAYTPTTNRRITRYQPTLLTATTGAPRFDHNPTTGESLGLLIEEQRTNYSPSSSNLNSFIKQIGGTTVQTNVVTSPDGEISGDKLTEGTEFDLNRIYESLGFSSGNYITFSVYAKSAERNQIQLSTSGLGWNNAPASARFDLLTGTIVSSSTTDGHGIEPVGNGWYRVWITKLKLNNTAGTFPIDIVKDGETFYTGDGYSGVYLWGAQTEVGPFPTSYIPTSGSQATRSADAASMTGTNFSSWFNPIEGTFIAECDRGNDGAEGAGICAARGPAAPSAFSNMIQFGEFYDNSGYVGRVYSNGVGEALIGATHTTGQGIYNKYSFAYKTDSVAGAINGILQDEDISANIPSTLDRLYFGRYDDDPTSTNLDGHIKYLKYFPTRIPNSQLQALTQP